MCMGAVGSFGSARLGSSLYHRWQLEGRHTESQLISIHYQKSKAKLGNQRQDKSLESLVD